MKEKNMIYYSKFNPCRAHPCLSWKYGEIKVTRDLWRPFIPDLCLQRVQVGQVFKVVFVWGFNIYEDEIPQPKCAPVPKPECFCAEKKPQYLIRIGCAAVCDCCLSFWQCWFMFTVHQGPELLSTQAAPALLGMGLFHFRCRTSIVCKMERTGGYETIVKSD